MLFSHGSCITLNTDNKLTFMISCLVALEIQGSAPAEKLCMDHCYCTWSKVSGHHCFLVSETIFITLG